MLKKGRELESIERQYFPIVRHASAFSVSFNIEFHPIQTLIDVFIDVTCVFHIPVMKFEKRFNFSKEPIRILLD